MAACFNISLRRCRIPSGLSVVHSSRNTLIASGSQIHQLRFYASKTKQKNNGRESREPDVPRTKDGNKGRLSTADLVPGSKQVLEDASQAELEKVAAKIQSTITWFKKQLAEIQSRGSGRVTPAILDSVRVEAGTRGIVKLDQVSTVGVRDGTTLMINVFEDEMTKHVEKALYNSKIPNVIPQRQDARTIKIPMPKPTIDSRKEGFLAASKYAEEARTQVRKNIALGTKKGKFEKHSKELSEFQRLNDRFIQEIDKLLESSKKALNV
ncbi:ribosome recycling factor [Sistotremastrum niveocremeum HHB9708]|uniref:Ribosome recycling factor n=1 Tax=Sistotremastrum niveocremeum HHB9708 TaxID=1314777 RepID=A0A164YVR6_9AGAM|nr:ribosome recycling factor [Sistotremastrum niveocremeum HHB9708]